jgi:hypothetical protein
MDLLQQDIFDLNAVYLDYRNHKITLDRASLLADIFLMKLCQKQAYERGYFKGVKYSLEQYRTGKYLLEDCIKMLEYIAPNPCREVPVFEEPILNFGLTNQRLNIITARQRKWTDCPAKFRVTYPIGLGKK